MKGVESGLLDFSRLEMLAAGDSPVHRLDPRTKVLVTAAFLVFVVLHGKYDLAGLAPLALYPVAAMALSGLPAGYILGKLLLASPFVLLVGVWNPVLDRGILVTVGGLPISGGWISFASIVVRFALTLSAALILIATTGFDQVCRGLSRLYAPKAFVLQLLLLYRYIFVLAGEAARMVRAFRLRNLSDERPAMRTYAALLGSLLVRALDRAQRIHMAMLSRGFDGEIRMSRPMRLRLADAAWAAFWIAFFILVRRYDIPGLLGQIVIAH